MPHGLATRLYLVAGFSSFHNRFNDGMGSELRCNDICLQQGHACLHHQGSISRHRVPNLGMISTLLQLVHAYIHGVCVSFQLTFSSAWTVSKRT